MIMLSKENRYYPLITTLVGALSFLAVAIVIGALSLLVGFDLSVLPLFVAGIVGPLVMFWILGKRERLLLNVIISSATLIFSFLLAFMLGYLVAAIVPGGTDNPAVNVVAILMMIVIYGTVMGVMQNGNDAAIFFLTRAAIIGIVLGLGIIVIGDIKILGLDLNYLYILTSFGITLGLLTGLYDKKK